MVRNLFCVGLGIFSVMALSLAAFGQTGSQKYVGATSHNVGKQQIDLHHYHLPKGNFQKAEHLNGSFLIGAAKGKKGNKLSTFALHAKQGHFAVSANNSTKGIRNAHVTTVVGQKGHHGKLHPNAGLKQNVSMDATQFVSLQDGDEEEYSLTQFGGGQVTITLLLQIGNTPNGFPIFAHVSFQMNLSDFLTLLGLNNGMNPNPSPNPSPFPNPNPNPSPMPDPNNPGPDPLPDPNMGQ